MDYKTKKNFKLPQEAHPVKIKQSEIDSVEKAYEHRNYSCELYMSCLTHAQNHHWTSFTCKSCEKFTKKEN